MNTNIYISEIVATRLSHDLIGNIGAVANACLLYTSRLFVDSLYLKSVASFWL